MKAYITKIHYSKGLSPFQSLIKTILLLCTPFYLAGITIRNLLYQSGLLKILKLNAYVISIGNLTTGGTGKTPLTIAIANYLKENLDKKVCILSRGYGGKLSSSNINVVSNGKDILYSAEMAGDEPYLMAKSTEFTPVITGKNRFLTGSYAIDHLNTNVLLLDDAYQHIKLVRNLNILVVDGAKLFGNSCVLPAGPLREPLSQIKRADKIVVINKNPNIKINNDCKLLNDLRQKFNKPVVMCNFKYGDIYDIRTGEIIDNKIQNIMAFSAIGQPEPFYQYLKTRYNLLTTKEFNDHHRYSSNDMDKIVQIAKTFDAQALITTEKDCVKLTGIIDNYDINFYALKIDLDLNLNELLDVLTKG